MPLGRFVYRIVVGSRPGANLIRSALASMNHAGDVAALRGGDLRRRPARTPARPCLAARLVAATAELRAVGRLQRLAEQRRADPCRGSRCGRPGSPVLGALRRPTSAAQLAVLRAERRREDRVGEPRVQRVPDRRPGAGVALAVEVDVQAAGAARCATRRAPPASAPARALGGVLPASSLSSSGVRTTDGAGPASPRRSSPPSRSPACASCAWRGRPPASATR